MKKLFNSKKEKENRNIHLHTYAKKKKKSHRPEYNYPNFKCTVTCQLKNVNANCLEIVLERATIQNLPNMFNKMFVCVCARARSTGTCGGQRFPGTRVTGNYEILNVEVKNQIQVFLKSIIYF